MRVPDRRDSPDNIALAEQLGYHRAWIYDTPQQSPDVWMTWRSPRNAPAHRLGPGVLVPSLRHPMVNAPPTATLCALAPGPSRSPSGPDSPVPRQGLPGHPLGVHGFLYPHVPGPAPR